MSRLIAVCFVLAAGTVAFAQGRAKAPPARPAQPAARPASQASAASACDRLAAHPSDPQKPASITGVADAAVVRAAIETCAAEVQQMPQSARLKFQLGRALWSAKRYDEAIEAFLQAEEMDYGPAAYYLGSATEEGLIEGQKPDLAAAADLYLVAASEGFSPAVEAYEGIEWDVDFSSYSSVAARMLYENDFREVTEASPLRDAYYREFIFYILGMQTFISQNPNEYAPSCQGVADAMVSTRLRSYARREFRMPKDDDGDPTSLTDIKWGIPGAVDALANMRADLSKQYGTDDAYAFALDFGGCNSAPFQRLYSNLRAFVLSRIPAEPSKAEANLALAALERQQAEIISGWYRQAGVQADKIAGLVANIDLTQKVAIGTLKPNRLVVAWVETGSTPHLHFGGGTDPERFGRDRAGYQELLFEVTAPLEVMTVTIKRTIPLPKGVSESGWREGAFLYILSPGWQSKVKRQN